MLEPEKLDYFKWQIPDGSRVRLTLLQEDDLEFLHKWKSQVDISYIISKPIEHISLSERQRRFKEKIPSVFAIRRITDNQFIGQISLYYNLNPKNRSAGIGYFTREPHRIIDLVIEDDRRKEICACAIYMNLTKSITHLTETLKALLAWHYPINLAR